VATYNLIRFLVLLLTFRDLLTVDLVGPLPKTKYGKTYLLLSLKFFVVLGPVKVYFPTTQHIFRVMLFIEWASPGG
jgi:hypothetical protein